MAYEIQDIAQTKQEIRREFICRAFAPKINGVRLMKGLSSDLSVVIELDLNYSGGANVTIETKLTGGMSIPAKISISALEGKANMISIAFAQDPGAHFTVESPITLRDNEYLKDMVNKLLGKLVRKIFLDQWVLPNWRSFFLPMMDAGSEALSQRQNSKAILASSSNQNAAAKKPSNIASRAAAAFWVSSSSTTAKGSDLKEASSPPRGHGNPPLTAPLDSLMGDYRETFSTRRFVNTRSLEDAQDLEDSLVKPFLEVCLLKDSEMASTGLSWKTSKNKGDVHLEKMKCPGLADIHRATVRVNCDADRVFSILSNPIHLHHIDDAYAGSTILKQFDESKQVRQTVYNFSKSLRKEYIVFEVKRQIASDLISKLAQLKDSAKTDDSKPDGGDIKPTESEQKEAASLDQTNTSESTCSSPTQETPRKHFVVIYRSVKGAKADLSKMKSMETISKPQISSEQSSEKIENDSGSIATSSDTQIQEEVKVSSPDAQNTASHNSTVEPTVHVYGYLIQASDDSLKKTSTITMLSQFSSDLSRLELSHANCRKIKLFIEELTELSSSIHNSGGSAENLDPDHFGDLLETGDLHQSKLSKRLSSHGAGSEVAEDGQKIDKLKTYISSTANYLMKSKKVGSWLGSTPTSTSSFSEVPMDSPLTPSMDPSATADSADVAGSSTPVLATKSSYVSKASAVAGAAYSMGAAAMRSRLKSKASTGKEEELVDLKGEELAKKDSVTNLLSQSPPSSSVLQDAPESISAPASTDPTSPPPIPPRSINRTAKKYNHLQFVSDEYETNQVIEKNIMSKDPIKIEVPFNGDGQLLAWEFSSLIDLPIQFGIVFRPFIIPSERGILNLYPESVHDKNERVILPLASVSTHLVPAKGSMCISSFSHGIFWLVFLSGPSPKNKLERMMTYRAAVRKAIFPTFDPLLSSIPIQLHTLSFDITVPRKSVYRIPFLFDNTMIGSDCNRVQLVWELVTSGSEVTFEVDIMPFVIERSGKCILVEPEPSSLPVAENDDVNVDTTPATPQTGNSSSVKNNRKSLLSSRLANVISQNLVTVATSAGLSSNVTGTKPDGQPNNDSLQTVYREVLYPSTKVSSGRTADSAPVTGSIDITSKCGVFVATLDNLNSLVMSKHVYIRLWIIGDRKIDE